MPAARSSALAGVLVALGLLATGCGDEGPAREPGSQDESSSGPVITLTKEWRYAPAAEVDGVLTLRSQCLVVQGDVAVWPKGAAWTGDGVLVDHHEFPVGNRVQGGGGEYPIVPSTATAIGETAYAQVKSCAVATGATRALVIFPGR